MIHIPKGFGLQSRATMWGWLSGAFGGLLLVLGIIISGIFVNPDAINGFRDSVAFLYFSVLAAIYAGVGSMVGILWGFLGGLFFRIVTERMPNLDARSTNKLLYVMMMFYGGMVSFLTIAFDYWIEFYGRKIFLDGFGAGMAVWGTVVGCICGLIFTRALIKYINEEHKQNAK